MRDMRNPVGWRRIPVPAKTGNRSVVFDMGVRFEQDGETSTRKSSGGAA